MRAEDLASIVNVVNLYAAALDCQRYELFDQVFTADVETDFGGPARWTGLAALKRDFAAIHAPFEATQHVTTNHHVTGEGDRANCLSYVVGRFIRAVPEGGTMFESGGWYDDALVRTAQGWRIRTRASRMIWWSGNPQVLQTADAVPPEPLLLSLKTEAQARRIAWLAAMEGRSL